MNTKKAITIRDVLQKSLPPSGRFIYEKNETTEFTPSPTPLTLSLLRLLHEKGGPIDLVYGAYGISYTPHDAFVTVGNELYVDREKELHTLFPAMSCFVSSDYVPRLSSFRGIVATIRNMRRMASLPSRPVPDADRLLMALRTPLSRSLKGAIDAFRRAYATVFEINLLCSARIDSLVRTGMEQTLSDAYAAGLLPLGAMFPRGEVNKLLAEAASWRGNSLEIADESPFATKTLRIGPVSGHTEGVRGHPDPVRLLLTLRELGRWLVVRHANDIRNHAGKAARSVTIAKHELCFATLGELLEGAIDPDRVRERREQYERFAAFSFPSVITDSREARGGTSKPVCLSAGIARGTLVTMETVHAVRGPKILFVRTLSPDVTVYLRRIAGLIAEQGSSLSHVAILAREFRVPAVSNVILSDFSLKSGDYVELDASSGTVQKSR